MLVADHAAAPVMSQRKQRGSAREVDRREDPPTTANANTRSGNEIRLTPVTGGEAWEK